MPSLDKAERRDKQRERKRKMVVTGRGLLTDVPNWERRLERDKKRKRGDAYDTREKYEYVSPTPSSPFNST